MHLASAYPSLTGFVIDCDWTWAQTETVPWSYLPLLPHMLILAGSQEILKQGCNEFNMLSGAPLGSQLFFSNWLHNLFLHPRLHPKYFTVTGRKIQKSCARRHVTGRIICKWVGSGIRRSRGWPGRRDGVCAVTWRRNKRVSQPEVIVSRMRDCKMNELKPEGCSREHFFLL